jgi:hypothetical protein
MEVLGVQAESTEDPTFPMPSLGVNQQEKNLYRLKQILIYFQVVIS